MRGMLISLAGASILSLSCLPAQSATCTNQWLAARLRLPIDQRFEQSAADSFGRGCLGVTAPRPISRREIDAKIESIITEKNSFVSSPPTDVAEFCPGYARATGAEKVGFWRQFFSQIIKYEAGTNSAAVMWDESASHKGGEYSIGLLQLSLVSGHGYGCKIDNEQDLLDPGLNLFCGVKTFEIRTRSRIGGDESHGKEGAAGYWSTLRVISQKPRPRGEDTRALIIKKVSALSQCKQKDGN